MGEYAEDDYQAGLEEERSITAADLGGDKAPKAYSSINEPSYAGNYLGHETFTLFAVEPVQPGQLVTAGGVKCMVVEEALLQKALVCLTTTFRDRGKRNEGCVARLRSMLEASSDA